MEYQAFVDDSSLDGSDNEWRIPEDFPCSIFKVIFLQLPRQKLLSIRRVCKKWKQLIEEDCALRRSLKLFRDYHSVQAYCYQLITCGLDTHDTFSLREPGQATDDDLVVTQPKMIR